MINNINNPGSLCRKKAEKMTDNNLTSKFLFLCIYVSVFIPMLLFVGSGQSKTIPLLSSEDANRRRLCATCTILVGLVEQLSDVHNDTVIQAFERLCTYLPSEYQSACKLLGDFFLPILIIAMEDKANGDVVCHRLGFCFTDPGKSECHLFRLPQGGIKPHVERHSKLKRDTSLRYAPAKFCELPGIKEVCEWISKIFNQHHPAIDADSDGFSTALTLRGISWRGKDCDESNALHHPGAKPINGDVDVDSNCNGIHGVEGATGTPYEDLYCKDTQAKGVVVLGDSVAAHFHIPEQWLDATQMSLDYFKDLTFILENELDWPEFSSSTGYKNSTYAVTTGPTQSIYNYMWQRNRCNHRDYQNIAVNGARSSSMSNDIIQSMSRNQATDKPLLAIYSLVGNDVCNGHPDTFAHMTTPEEMRENFQKTLEYLDDHIPAGSHLVVSGLADGRILYNLLHDRIHPIGRVRNDVTYAMLYDYLNCLEISPCTGWLSSNETVRNMTTERAWLLNKVLMNVSETYKANNFVIQYMDFSIELAIKKWEAQGGQGWQLIDPVDGFHTSQLGQSLSAEIFWGILQHNMTSFIGPVNPHNRDIEATFGDQGGYE